MEIRWPLQQLQAMGKSGERSSETLVLKPGDQLTAAVLEVEKGRDALLAFGQFRAYARMPVPVVSGQNVRIQVEQAGQGVRILMAPTGPRKGQGAASGRLEIRIFEPVAERLSMDTPTNRLKAGTTLQGRITGFEKQGLKLIDFGNFKAFAKIDIPVRQGQIVPLAVLRSGKEISLAFDHQPGTKPAGVLTPSTDSSKTPQSMSLPVQSHALASADLSRQAAGRASDAWPSEQLKSKDIGGLRQQVQQLLDGDPRQGQTIVSGLSAPVKKAFSNLQRITIPASPQGDLHTLIARVRAFVENSGIYFEKQLEQEVKSAQGRSGGMDLGELAKQSNIRNLMIADMKPNLLIVNNFLNSTTLDVQGTERHWLETIKSVVQRALRHIDQQQIGATEKPVDPEVLQAFSHLLFLTDDPKNAQLRVYYRRKGKGGEQKTPRVSLLLDMDPLGRVRTDLWIAARDLNITFFVPHADIQTRIQNEQSRIVNALASTFNTVAIKVVVNVQKIEDFDGEDLQTAGQRQLDVNV